MGRAVRRTTMGGEPRTVRVSCKAPGCLRSAPRGYCKRHAYHAQTHGNLAVPSKSPQTQFWARVDKRGPRDCWPWKKGTNGQGYGFYTWEGKQRLTHRIAYTLTNGPIPDGLQIDHRCHTPDCTDHTKCRHRLCCNPVHLKAVTNAENNAADRTRRHTGPRVTHCPKGHEYTEDNTRIGTNGYRNCRTCERARKR